jgi:parallel beta-helix repeat protein
MKRTRTTFLTAALLAAAGLPTGLATRSPAHAVAPAAQRIVVTTTIQAAVDAAQPGDTVVVPPGLYPESVTIRTSSLTLTGSRAAVIDATGFSSGILVNGGASVPGPPPRCPVSGVHDVTIRGLTIRNAGFTGVNMRGVNGFEVSGGRYLDDGLYGVFPRCASNGTVSGNEVSGVTDAALYIGSADQVDLTNNRLTSSVVGVEVENSTNITVTRNRVSDNAAGIIAFVLPGRPVPVTDGVLIANNQVTNNNQPNPFPVDRTNPVSLIPGGTGVLSAAGDHVTITRNTVTGNRTGGIAVVDQPDAAIDPRVDPNPNFNRVTANTVVQNGGDPDTVRSPFPGADLLYDATGSANCFGGNRFGTDFPAGITTLFTCQP